MDNFDQKIQADISQRYDAIWRSLESLFKKENISFSRGNDSVSNSVVLRTSVNNPAVQSIEIDFQAREAKPQSMTASIAGEEKNEDSFIISDARGPRIIEPRMIEQCAIPNKEGHPDYFMVYTIGSLIDSDLDLIDKVKAIFHWPT